MALTIPAFCIQGTANTSPYLSVVVGGYDRELVLYNDLTHWYDLVKLSMSAFCSPANNKLIPLF